MFYDKHGNYVEDYSNYVIKYILESNLKDSHKLSIIKNINDVFFENLKKLIEKYSSYIDLKRISFPTDWEKHLDIRL